MWGHTNGLILNGLLTGEAHRCPSSDHPPAPGGRLGRQTTWVEWSPGGNDGGKQRED